MPFYWQLEDGSGYWQLEDGSGNWLLESSLESTTVTLLEGTAYIQTILTDDGLFYTILDGTGNLQTSLNDDAILY